MKIKLHSFNVILGVVQLHWSEFHFFAERLCWGAAAFFPSTPLFHKSSRMFWNIQGIFLFVFLGETTKYEPAKREG
jgi:hypothetical protein